VANFILLAESVPLIIIIVGVTVLVIIVLIVALVFVLCQRQNNKKSPPESEYHFKNDFIFRDNVSPEARIATFFSQNM
jgi:hypothetical protein